MGLTELFNEWIVERGSAKVQEKHIALFRDQLALADKRITELTSENSILKTKLEEVDSDLQESQKKNEILRSKIQEYENPTEQPTHKNLLDEAKVNILKILFRQNKLLVEQLAQILGSEDQTVQFHLEELKSKKMIKDGFTHGKYSQIFMNYSIDQEGRRYLIENKIIT